MSKSILVRMSRVVKSWGFNLGILLGTAASLTAQNGDIGTSEIVRVAVTVMNAIMILGAVAVVIGIGVSIWRFLGHDKVGGFAGIVVILLGGICIGYSKSWAQSVTGQQLP